MNRNSQIDGWRCFAVLGVMWLHWAPRGWRGALPFEIGLYFFLTLTGFLITRILLRERIRRHPGESWRRAAYLDFLQRRAMRILLPCYVAMVFAWLVGASDLREHPLCYLAHLSNFRMAYQDAWPSGTAHYWTLAIQVHFYLVWPLVVFFTPLRTLPWAFVAAILGGAVFRASWQDFDPAVRHVQALTPTALDYFGSGALLAWIDAKHRGGVGACKRWLKPAAILLLAGYAALYIPQEMLDARVPWIGDLQQPLLALAFAAMIGTTLGGLHGPLGKSLNHPLVQKIGSLSFGLYLFHSCVPLLLGHILPQLWWPVFDGPLEAFRLLVFFAVSWGMAEACRRWLEQPFCGQKTPATL